MLDNKVRSTYDILINTINEYNDIDPEHLCSISNCNSILIYQKDSQTYKAFERIKNTLKYDNTISRFDKRFETLLSIGEVLVTKDFDFLYELKEYNIIIVTSQTLLLQAISSNWVLVDTMLFIFCIIFFINQEIQIKKRNSQQVMGATSILREKNMQLLTENINHELNTPLAIISGLIHNMEIQLNSLGLTFTFDQIYSSLDQIKTVLERMSNFKQIKYSNGNKTLYDIVSYSANSMSIYKKYNFQINVTKELKYYGVDNNKLNNADVLNLVTNHFKNSLEAMADRIETSVKFDEKHKLLYLYIVDNGTGVKGLNGQLIPPNKYDCVFDPYWSTKNEKGEFIFGQIEESRSWIKRKISHFRADLKIWLNPGSYGKIRGIGLYLNRQFLLDAGGDIKLIETSEKGTVFVLKLPAYDKNILKKE
jgi:signal transduction histidine kinase